MKKTFSFLMLNLIAPMLWVPKHYFAIFSMICFPIISSSQTVFEIVHGGNGVENARSIIQTADGGYAITGSSTSLFSGSADVFLLKLKPDGGWEWNKFYGGFNIDWGYSLLQIADGGYLISGITNSIGNGGYDAYIIRTDSSGDTLWTRTIGGTDWDFSYYVEETNDHGFIISGSSFQNSSEDLLLVRLDSAGGIVWQKTYNGQEGGRFYCVQKSFDTGFICAGEIKTAGDKNILLMKVNSNGDSVWSKSFGSNTFDDIGYFVEQTIDSGFILSGRFSDTLTGIYQIALIKTDSSGNVVFQKHIDGFLDNDISNCVHQCIDKGFIVSGYTKSSGAGGKDFILMKFDSMGVKEWGRTYGGASDDESFNMQVASDYGFVLTGETYSYGTSTPNIYVVKTDSSGVASGSVVIGFSEIVSQAYNHISIHPNPAKDQFTIILRNHNNSKLSDLQLSLTNILGEIIHLNIESQSFNGNYISIFVNANSISNGVYILNVKTPSSEYFTKVLIDKN